MTNIPFNVDFHRIIILTGDLDGSAHSKDWLKIHLTRAIESSYDKTLYIDAAKMRITPDGLQDWLDFVHSELMEHNLIYLDSQLSDLLVSEDDYKHENSLFPESVVY